MSTQPKTVHRALTEFIFIFVSQVDVGALESQAKERQRREEEAARARSVDEAQQLQYAEEVERLNAEADHARKQNSEVLARRHKEQAAAKQERDAELQELYRNRVDAPAYFGQFGTSHR